MKQGQLTIFVLIGIILVATVFFATYVALQLSAEQQERRQDQIDDQQQAYDQLNQYLRSCVETNIVEATNQVFRQGGYLYEDQNGTASRDNTVSYAPEGTIQANDVKVGLRSAYPCSEAYAEPPEYPAGETRFDNYDDYGEDGSCYGGAYDIQASAGYLGVVDFPRTCTVSSSNRINNLDNEFTDVQCGITYAVNPVHALETHLENATANILRNCADNTSQVASIGSSIDIVGTPNVSVAYGEESTLFDATVPFEATAATASGSLQRTRFTYEANLPLLDVWNDLYQALREDAIEPSHNISEELSSYRVFTEEQDNHTVYEIQAEDISWGGNPLTVITAVENRSAALDHIDRHPEDGVDVAVKAGNQLLLQPDVIDPDDKAQPSRGYDGLGETRTAIDPTGRVQPYEPLSQARVNPSDGPTTPPTPGNALSDNPVGTHSIGDPYAWGLYTTTVEARQNGDREDYQDVNVLVVDNPLLQIGAYSPEQEETLSVETPITINGSQSEPPQAFGQQPVFNASWLVNGNSVEASLEGFTTDKILDASIKNIDAAHQTLGINEGETEIELTASANTTYKDNIQNTVSDNIEVKACKPNIGETGQPYPYNQTDPYQTSNPCCAPPGSIEGTSITCYEQTSNGPSSELLNDLNEFNESLNTYAETSVDYSIIADAENQLESASGDASLYVARSCGGNRGNTCGGPISVEVTT